MCYLERSGLLVRVRGVGIPLRSPLVFAGRHLTLRVRKLRTNTLRLTINYPPCCHFVIFRTGTALETARTRFPLRLFVHAFCRPQLPVSSRSQPLFPLSRRGESGPVKDSMGRRVRGVARLAQPRLLSN